MRWGPAARSFGPVDLSLAGVKEVVPELQGVPGLLLVHDLDGETGVDHGPVAHLAVDHGDVGGLAGAAEIYLGVVSVDADDLPRNGKAHVLTRS